MIKPKKQKPLSQKTAENFFPIEKGFKVTTEKQVKEPAREEILKGAVVIEEKPKPTQVIKEEFLKVAIEKQVKKPERKELEKVEKITEKGKRMKKSFDKENKKDNKKIFQSKSFQLDPSGYELIITEKPQAAQKIAAALGHAKKLNNNGIAYYEVNRQGDNLVVACAVGHLFTLKQNESGSGIPIFDISWVPNYLARKKDFTKKYYDTLYKLARGARAITVATDFDIEGEVIGLNIVRFICGQKDAQRMKFSTLTDAELNNAYDHKLPHLEWGQAIAGETRHYLDWFYGINLSRALMNAIKSTGKFKIMSIGRVQGPSLKLIVDRELEIQAFKSKPYWQIFITLEEGKQKVELIYNKDIFDKKELTKFQELKGKTAECKTEKKQESLPPNPPFNLTTLQTESYKFYGLNPSRTLQIAQSLYLAGLISYPRTSSQKLPDSISYKPILKKLAKEFEVEHLIKTDKPIEGPKTDPAHPSIYPTGERQILSGEEEKIYNLIVRRFLSLFCENAVVDRKRITAKIEDYLFSANGSQIAKKAWMEIYPNKMKEENLPDIEGKKKVIDSRIEEKETQPPKRYSPASILSELEKRNLGTKATRAAILETLYDRGYVQDQAVKATPLGISLIKTLSKYSPIIIDEQLTRHFEEEMEEISESKKDIYKEERKVIDEAKEAITKITTHFKEHNNKIGSELMEANSELIEQKRKENTLMQCPKCKKGNLAINYSKKNRKYFVACNAYPECKNTYSLPPNGNIKKLDKPCEKCGFPLMMSLRKGKKPWIFCFNKDCESNKQRLEEYQAKKAAEEAESKEEIQNNDEE